jgi:5-methylcytosine-specific restriction endonuclease McrA
MSKIGVARAMFKNMKLPITCSICLKDIRFREDLTIDHITPRSKGGTSSLDNLQPAHKICNQKKGNTMEYQS